MIAVIRFHAAEQTTGLVKMVMTMMKVIITVILLI